MSKTRPTKEIKTTNGHTVVIKEYATGGEFEEIQGCYLAGANVDFEGQAPRVTGFKPADADRLANSKMIELLVVSVDGVSEDLVTTVRDLRKEDYMEVLDALNEATGKKVVAASSAASANTSKSV